MQKPKPTPIHPKLGKTIKKVKVYDPDDPESQELVRKLEKALKDLIL